MEIWVWGNRGVTFLVGNVGLLPWALWPLPSPCAAVSLGATQVCFLKNYLRCNISHWEELQMFPVW